MACVNQPLTVHKNTTCSSKHGSHVKILILLPAMFKGKVITNQTQKEWTFCLFSTLKVFWTFDTDDGNMQERSFTVLQFLMIQKYDSNCSKWSLLSPTQILSFFKSKPGALQSILQFFIRNAAMKIWPVSSATICDSIFYSRFFHMPPNHPTCHNWWCWQPTCSSPCPIQQLSIGLLRNHLKYFTQCTGAPSQWTQALNQISSDPTSSSSGKKSSRTFGYLPQLTNIQIQFVSKSIINNPKPHIYKTCVVNEPCLFQLVFFTAHYWAFQSLVIYPICISPI
jgi:hypothetical protein